MSKLGRTLTLGAIFGFIAGLLMAPQKGEDTRKKVGEAIEKGKEKLNEVKTSFIKDPNEQ
ncbi:MAG TPA: YtxH domain-containing protein [Candidatus Omnitrophota bacterium]|nr:YtxH domain-containing protein [Candidatus Omnitrophota bacterium]